MVSKQTLAHAGRKAAKLCGRGVRRVFAIDVERSRALEWSTALATWRVLDAAGHIVDQALAVPLPINTLIHSAKTDDALARALIAKHNAVIEANRAEGKAEGTAFGCAQGRVEGLAQGRVEGLAQGMAEGLAQGRVEGLAQGKAVGLAEAVIALLATRGVRWLPLSANGSSARSISRGSHAGSSRRCRV